MNYYPIVYTHTHNLHIPYTAQDTQTIMQDQHAQTIMLDAQYYYTKDRGFVKRQQDEQHKKLATDEKFGQSQLNQKGHRGQKGKKGQRGQRGQRDQRVQRGQTAGKGPKKTRLMN